jgi:hypothetical protein
MSASSVTGTGLGSADGKNKGSDHMSLGVGKLIGTRIVASGSVALTSGTPSTATVTFEATLPGVAGDYIVMAVPVGNTAVIAAAGVAVSALSTTSFVLTGPNTVSTTIYWAVIKVK